MRRVCRFPSRALCAAFAVWPESAAAKFMSSTPGDGARAAPPADGSAGLSAEEAPPTALPDVASALKTLTSTVETLTSAVKALDVRVATLTSKVEDVDVRVARLQSGLSCVSFNPKGVQGLVANSLARNGGGALYGTQSTYTFVTATVNGVTELLLLGSAHCAAYFRWPGPSQAPVGAPVLTPLFLPEAVANLVDAAYICPNEDGRECDAVAFRIDQGAIQAAWARAPEFAHDVDPAKLTFSAWRAQLPCIDTPFPPSGLATCGGVVALSESVMVSGVLPQYSAVPAGTSSHSRANLIAFVELAGEPGNSGALLFAMDNVSNAADPTKPLGVYYGMWDGVGQRHRARGVCVPLGHWWKLAQVSRHDVVLPPHGARTVDVKLQVASKPDTAIPNNAPTMKPQYEGVHFEKLTPASPALQAPNRGFVQHEFDKITGNLIAEHPCVFIGEALKMHGVDKCAALGCARR